MSYITKSFTIIITLTQCSKCLAEGYDYNFNYYNVKQYTRNITIKQGTLQGLVVEPKSNHKLPPVEQYLGIPYAAPPIGDLRFMPSGAPPSWFGNKLADTFGPVCPQKFPNETEMAPERRNHFQKLKKYLENESEDCLYLNIYAPFQEEGKGGRVFPVMVFIHGESFEWNSGNPYDGSVLAAYGKVIVVTLNFRLGILGFLKAGTEEHSRSNFGLVDQIAALVWVKENIGAFGGDSNAVTLFGHGTGAVCASLLMLSPIVLQEGNEILFQRAILMGGTALADWALAGNPREVTYQVAQALNCQLQDDFAGCLRRKRLDEIMSATATTAPYRTRFGPVVDSLVVPNDPKKSMTQYHDIFKRFELMYGVTEMESINLLGPVALLHGMLEKERDQELRKYLRSRCEMNPELCLARTLDEYTKKDYMKDGGYGDYTGEEPDPASVYRDTVLDILSDARYVAPVAQTGKYHARLNLQSYYYVFTLKTASKEYIRNKSYNGEELPYVFGVPLDGPKFHFTDSYTPKEKLFSEIVMMYFSNFAYTGNPNVPRRSEFYTLSRAEWFQYDVEWPEFDLEQQRFLRLEIPPQPDSHYRIKEVKYWNDIFPHVSEPLNAENPPIQLPPIIKPPPSTSKKYPLWFLNKDKKGNTMKNYENFYKPYEKNEKPIFGIPKLMGEERPHNIVNQTFGVLQYTPPEDLKASSASNTIIILLALFLVANVMFFMGLFYMKCYRKKERSQPPQQPEIVEEEKNNDKGTEEGYLNGCNIVRMISKSSKSDDTYEAVKVESGSSKMKMKRQLSNSTIDAHTKVRDWITQEIINRYSPRFLRRGRHGKRNVPESDVCIPIDLEKDSTLGRSPTRPVSPAATPKSDRPGLVKSASIGSTPKGKPEKVSVAIDATPSGRGPSVLMQQPIELTKSLDYPSHPEETNLRRSVTLEDFSPRTLDSKELRKSTTSINLKFPTEPTIIKIEHSHSKSEPVQDIYACAKPKKLRTFDPDLDINVTSREETDNVPPLTPEESLMTIKRRNFPKVLPDHPGREALMQKRRSMPAHSLFLPIPETSSFSQPNSPNNKNQKLPPPAPPPRLCSTLGRRALAQNQSEPTLAEEPPISPEPEVTCNNLYVGPLIPKNKEPRKINSLDRNQIYDQLKTPEELKVERVPQTVVTANSNLIKRNDPKIIVKPNLVKKVSDPKIPRVVVPDNQPHIGGESEGVKRAKKSQIPTLIKSVTVNKESSSSESTPSEESDTGTVVKRI